MDRNLKKTVKRLLLLDTVLNLTNSFSNNINDLSDGLDEIFDTVTDKKRKIKDVLYEENNGKRNDI